MWQVRGKIVLFSRFDDSGAGWPNGDSGIGIHPTTWPDTYKGTFEWDCNGTTVRTQDWLVSLSIVFFPYRCVLIYYLACLNGMKCLLLVTTH